MTLQMPEQSKCSQYNLKPKTQTDLILRQVRSLFIYLFILPHKCPGVQSLAGQCLYFPHMAACVFVSLFSPKKSGSLPANKDLAPKSGRGQVRWRLMLARDGKKNASQISQLPIIHLVVVCMVHV